ncbi:MAG: alpha/beta hydrolase [Desulfobacterales bacterium]|nr:alpha/beta hydrolase [Desulfobacterales bacterium]
MDNGKGGKKDGGKAATTRDVAGGSATTRDVAGGSATTRDVAGEAASSKDAAREVASSRDVAGDVAGSEHRVPHDGMRLHVWEKYRGEAGGKPIVVLAHGSATGGRESFDLQAPGRPTCSLMDFLAGEGFDVFAPDIRGFGRSTRPGGPVTTRDAAGDLRAVVDHILKIRGARKVNLLAWSWGTQYGGMFVMSHPGRTAGYVSYAQMHPASPDLARRRARVDLYRKNPYIHIPESDWKLRFYSMTPREVNDPVIVDAYAEAAARVERKTPTGPQLDMATILPMVHPRLIEAPTMIIHGAYDDVADLHGLLPFFKQLPHPDKRYVVIPDAGHMMHLQKGHRRFQREVAHFFKAVLDDPGG